MKWQAMNIVVTKHAMTRFNERFGLTRKELSSIIKQNLENCIIYKQFQDKRLIVCDDFVLGIAVTGKDGNKWIVKTVMDQEPFYLRKERKEARERKLGAKIVLE